VAINHIHIIFVLVWSVGHSIATIWTPHTDEYKNMLETVMMVISLHCNTSDCSLIPRLLPAFQRCTTKTLKRWEEPGDEAK